MESLPLELLEAIANAPALHIDQHHVRSLLRATCRIFREIIAVPPVSAFSKNDRILTWFRNGASVEFIKRNQPHRKNIGTLAAACGRLDVLMADQYPRHSQICYYSAANGYLDCLRYAHEAGYICDSNTCMAAAANGHLHCLQYLRGRGCRWNSKTCREAATHGYLDCLQYAHESGCKITAKAVI